MFLTIKYCFRDSGYIILYPGKGAIEICLSEKGALAKKGWETLI